jgi:hypothetical protein
MKIKISFILLSLLLSSALMAQTAKKKKAKETKSEVAVDQFAEVVAIEDVSSSASSDHSSFEPLHSIRYNDKYEVYSRINDRFDFYCEKYSKNRYNNLGIVDKDGNVILPHLFSKSYSNSNSYEVLLNMNNNYGLFNLNELRWSIPMEYEDLNDLGNNLYSAKKNGKWGVVDDNNSVIVPFEWSQISNISGLDNYIIVTSNEYPNRFKGVYSLVERKLAIPCIYSSLHKIDRQNYFLVNKDSKSNIIDINNIQRFSKWYDEITVPSRGRSYYIVKIDNKFGVIDDNEKEIIPVEYTEFATYPYSDGSYLARNKEGKYGFILIDGRVTLPFEYDNLTRRYNDNVVSVQNGKCGLVQVNAGVPYEIVTCDYDDIKSGSKTFIVEKNKKFGLLDIYGKLITPVEYDSLESLDENAGDGAIYKAKKEGIYQLINEQGKVVGQELFTDISIIPKKNNDSYSNLRFTYMKAKQKNGKYCIIDKVGKIISKPIFEDIVSESENIFIVKSNSKFGMYSLLDQNLSVNYKYDLIIRTDNNYYGFLGKKIDFLIVKSGQVSTVSTVK